MMNQAMKSWRKGALLAAALCSTTALAGTDMFGLGSGRDGALTVSAAGTVINVYTQVTGPLVPTDTAIPVASTAGIAAGDLVMVLQTTGIVPPPSSGSQTTIDLTTHPVGRWELARVASVGSGTLTLSAPLLNSYAASVTQLIRVPEYTSVTATAGTLTAPLWNGSTGGVVAFLATGTVTLGTGVRITASGVGFRGGAYVDDPTGNLGCSGFDEAAPSGAQKGEGIANTRYGSGSTGRGNVANGAGGGVCFHAGGGGGGSAGAGGKGGHSSDGDRDAGGLGGAALTYSDLSHLTLGGGGGSGHGSDPSVQPGGGRGGGIVFIRANQLSGAGSSISTAGAAGGPSSSDGASGGGAGGTIYLRIAGSAACTSLQANGGIGGSANSANTGPGGGGGGGRVIFQSASGTCPAQVGGATSGTELSGSPYGAQAGSAGTGTTLSGGFRNPAPVVVTPANGSITNNPRPPITGTAEPGATVHVYVDGVEVGQTTADASGNWSLTPTSDLAEGARQASAAIELQGVWSPRSTTNNFTIDLTPPNTSVVTGPPMLTRSGSAPFDFSATEAGSFECNLDGAGFTACADPVTLAVGEGNHTLQVRARDLAGNVDLTPASYSWTVDQTPPNTTIVSGPPMQTRSTTAAFELTSNETGSTFECSLDGSPFMACAASSTFPGLSDGSHTLQVRAIDPIGNADPSPASHTWTVDQTPPDTSIVSGPPALSSSPSGAFDFGSTEAGSTFECSLDGATFTACLDPATFPDLSDGSHTLQVRAIDPAGNVDASPASHTWTIERLDLTFRGGGCAGCAAGAGDPSLVLAGLAALAAVAARRRRR